MRDSHGRFIKGHIVPQEWRESFREKTKGRKCSAETIEKLRERMIGNTINLGKKRPNQAGINHWRWKGGRIIKGGYAKVRYKGKYVFEHHLKWCIANQMPVIPKGCVIHHRNENRLDNNPENLVLLPANFHNELHWRNEKMNNINRFRGVD